MIPIRVQKRFVFAFILSLIVILGFSGFAHAILFSGQNFSLQNSRFARLQPVTELTVAQPRNDLKVECDIVETARANDSLQTFINLFEELGMTEDLRGYGRFTVFMPNDEAFVPLEDQLQTLRQDRSALATLLSYHVVASGQPIMSTEMNTPMSVRTVARRDLEITRRGGEICVGDHTGITQGRRGVCGNNAQIIVADIEASNGVIHVIDKVLLP